MSTVHRPTYLVTLLFIVTLWTALGCSPESGELPMGDDSPAAAEPSVADAMQDSEAPDTAATCPTARRVGDGAHHAGLVVTWGDGSTEAFCVAFDDAEVDGYALLRKAPLSLVTESYTSPRGVGICKLSGEPSESGQASDGCNYPDEACFCAADPVRFWTIWQRREGEWAFSTTGALQTMASDGNVLGFRWGDGQTGGTPAPCDFATLCAASDRS